MLLLLAPIWMLGMLAYIVRLKLYNQPKHISRHGHPWVFNITPILGRYARTELVCPIPYSVMAASVDCLSCHLTI